MVGWWRVGVDGFIDFDVFKECCNTRPISLQEKGIKTSIVELAVKKLNAYLSKFIVVLSQKTQNVHPEGCGKEDFEICESQWISESWQVCNLMAHTPYTLP